MHHGIYEIPPLAPIFIWNLVVTFRCSWGWKISVRIFCWELTKNPDGNLRLCSHLVPENDSWWTLMWTHLFFKYPRQNSGAVPVPEYKVTQALNRVLIPYLHTFFVSSLALYPETTALHTHNSLVCLNAVGTCLVCWVWTHQHIGYPVSEHNTILCRCPGTSACAPSVNTT